MNEGFGHRFRNPDLLRQALRHRSVGVPHNERMEFVGDALVNLIVAEALHERWPKADEGALTRARASLVRESALAEIARTLGIGELVNLGPGELKSGGHRRDSILADTLEAVVAAIHMDVGFESCRAIVLSWFEPLLANLPVGKVDKDAKTRLQEWLQARQLPLPVYALIESRGEEHARIFRVQCLLQEPNHCAEAEAGALRTAEQAAATMILALLEIKK